MLLKELIDKMEASISMIMLRYNLDPETHRDGLEREWYRLYSEHEDSDTATLSKMTFLHLHFLEAISYCE